MLVQPLISVVIPVYNEKNIITTIQRLQKQDMWIHGLIEIILAEYNENSEQSCIRALSDNKLLTPKCRIVPVDRKGIAYARHAGIVNSSPSSNIIVNFDADAYFGGSNDIMKLTTPIAENKVLLTCCDNEFDDSEVTVPEISNNPTSYYFVKGVLNTLNVLQALPILSGLLEPGLTIRKDIYFTVQGFHDVTQYEGALLAAKVIHHYGVISKQRVEGVTVYVSPRRAIASTNMGLVETFADYSSAAFRDLGGNTNTNTSIKVHDGKVSSGILH